MTMNCPDPTRYDRIDNLAEGDALLVHLEECPRCRSLLKARRAFEAAPELSGEEEARCADADTKASSFLADALGLHERAPVHGTSSSPSPRSIRSRLTTFLGGSERSLPWWPPALVASLAIILVAILILPGRIEILPFEKTSPFESPMRGEGDPHSGFSVPTARLEADGSLELHWTAYEGADSYQVLLWSELLQLVESIPVIGETNVVLGTEVKPLSAAAMFFCVVAKAGQVEIGRSEMIALP